MKLSPEGLALIKRFEGLRLEAYQDVAGIWTIGYGHTKTAKKGMTVTEAEADALLLGDVSEFEEAVNSLGLDLPQHRFDALVSLAFNIGVTAFLDSTLLKKLRMQDHEAVSLEFMRWNKATVKGEKIPVAGLTRRRRTEQRLYRGEGYGG